MMGDPKNPNDNSLFLPGSRFFPTDQQLISFYLTNKNTHARSDSEQQQDDVIKEIDLYQFDPFDLPVRVSFRFGRGGRKRHYYCFVAMARVLKEKGDARIGGSGVWRRCGRVRDVVGTGVGDAVVGVRKKFVFFLGKERTDWVLYEYSLLNKDLASFVLCRVFVKSRKNKGSENPLSSCGEGSVATVRHIGIQHDGINKLVNGEDNMLDNKFPDHNNKVLRFPRGLNSEPHDGVTSEPGGVKMISSGPSSGREMIVDSLISQELAAILEEDFIELNDLVSPLMGID